MAAIFPPSSSKNSLVELSTEVRAALSAREPVVALESTIIAHGLPHPQNLRCALTLERTVRAHGATPATVAVLDGRFHAGLDATQLRDLAEQSHKYPKLALRDLPMAVARGGSGATTVSATTHIAQLAGIRLFATGGVGGVHRGPHLDVSQDILALATRRVLVVCAGVKSVLHIPNTLEALEAASVPVLVWRSRRFPAFYITDSGSASPNVTRDARDVAAVFYAAGHTACSAGILLAVPIPEEHAASAAKVERAVHDALRECEQSRIVGKEVTPFLLRRVAELSGGESLRANVALAEHNASVAAQVAVELCKLERIGIQGTNETRLGDDGGTAAVDVVVTGIAAVDIICTAGKSHLPGTSNPGRVVRALGGVACNMARAAAGAGRVQVALVASLGDDSDAALVRSMLEQADVNVAGLITLPGARTPVYCAVHDSRGELQSGIADMDAAHAAPSALVTAVRQALAKPQSGSAHARVVAIDANLSVDAIHAVAAAARVAGALTWFEPTSVSKAVRVVKARALQLMTFVSPNLFELAAIANALDEADTTDEERNARALLRAGVRFVIVTRGSRGAALYNGSHAPLQFPAYPVEQIHNTSGAGDALAGAMIAHIVSVGYGYNALRDALQAGLQAASLACVRGDSAAYDGTLVRARL